MFVLNIKAKIIVMITAYISMPFFVQVSDV